MKLQPRGNGVFRVAPIQSLTLTLVEDRLKNTAFIDRVFLARREDEVNQTVSIAKNQPVKRAASLGTSATSLHR